MIKNKELLQTCLYQLKSLSLGERLIFKTAKKDREIIVTKKAEGYRVEENGFEHAIFEIADETELKKILKTLQKVEFPRSHQLWMKIERSDIV